MYLTFLSRHTLASAIRRGTIAGPVAQWLEGVRAGQRRVSAIDAVARGGQVDQGIAGVVLLSYHCGLD
eukprot:10934664-Lingulodinium_polyedra.AAC.1